MYFFDEESIDNIQENNEEYNYKGYFIENNDQEEKQYYENGAHFPYKYLYQKLELLLKERESQKIELENKLKEKESRDDHSATSGESKKNENNLRDIINFTRQKGKSRNKNKFDIGLTFVPKVQSNNKNKDLMKSTSGRKYQFGKSNKCKSQDIKYNKKKNNSIINKDYIRGKKAKNKI